MLRRRAFGAAIRLGDSVATSSRSCSRRPNQAEALAIEAKLREALNTITRPRPWWAVTFSIGIATFETMPASADAAMGYVDQLMYRAKRSGKAHTISAVFDDTLRGAEGAGSCDAACAPKATP